MTQVSALPQCWAKSIPTVVLACGLFVGAINPAVAETGVRADAATVARGATVYKSYCQSCHEKDGVGEARVPWSIRLPGLIEAMPLNETSHAWHHSDEQLTATLLDGNERSRLRMPPFRNILSMQDVSDVIGYLKTFWSDRILACQGPEHMRCM